MRRQRQTKILATLGPASNTKEIIKKLFETGVDAFRLNFSHGSHETHAKNLGFIRDVEKECGRPICVLADMQGPKLRLGEFENGSIKLTEGMEFRFDMDKTPGNEQRVCLPHPEVLGVLNPGDFIFLDDGKVRARIKERGDDYVTAIIESGSKLSDRKGLNVPNAIIPVPALTKKDRVDLKAALDMGVDWIAQSFVQTPEDVQEALDLIKGRASLMVKLEKPSAIEKLDDIIALADGIMIARGDLGVEIPPEDVPAVQKRIIRKVRDLGKPVVVATQMLESMIENARPTRAEASDVATAVYDGTDAVMLSAETAAGAHPIEAVEIMNRICKRTEADETYEQMIEANHPDTLGSASDAITMAAYFVAHDIEAKCIVTYTQSGSTAQRMSRQRPDVPILCLTPELSIARRMALSYGVHAVYDPRTNDDFSGPAPHATEIVKSEGFAASGDKFVMTAGVPFGQTGSTNILRISDVD